jgi:phospholipid/cholesterol/gamma-HCH transport system substrate-binding protein
MTASTAQVWKRRAHLAQALVIAILVAGTVYIADTIVGGGLFHRGYELEVELSEAAGLHPNSAVNYRGQRIGKVLEVRINPDDEVGIIARIRIEEKVDIPLDSDVEVRHLSAIGEQYLDFRPRSAGGPFFGDGDVVALADTHTPLGVPEVLANAQSLMKTIDADDIATLAAVTNEIFSDADVDLRALSIELELAFDLLLELEPALTDLVVNAETPLRTVTDLDPTIRALLDDLALVTDSIRTSTPTVRSLVLGATDFLPRLDAWWREVHPELSALLDDTIPLSVMAADHLRGLHHWLDWVPSQADVMAGSTRDGSGRVLLVPKILDNCIYEPNVARTMHDLDPRPNPTTVHCVDPPIGTQGRGSANAPQQ